MLRPADFAACFPHLRFGRGALLLVSAVLVLSVLLGVACGMPWTILLGAIGGAALLAALVWDLRIVVPILILTFPLGPRFEAGFGNLYLSTTILVIAYAAWLTRGVFLARPLTLYLNRVVIGIAVFLGVLVISAMQNLPYLLAHQSDLLRFIQLFLYSGFFSLVLAMTFSRREIKLLLLLVILAGLAEAVVGLLRWRHGGGLFVHGTFEGGHSDFAVYAIFIAMIVLGVVLESRSAAVSVGAIAILAAVMLAIVLSFSRGGYASLTVGMLCLLAMPFNNRRKVGAFGVFAASVLLLIGFGPFHILYKFKEIMTTATATSFPISVVYRLGMWREALADFSSSPILGVGTWSYGLRDNFYMKVLGEAGIAGLAAFVWLLITIVREERRAVVARPQDDFVRGIALGIVPATVACLVVFELSGDYFLNHRFMGTFWVVLALTLKYCLNIGIRERAFEQTAS
jgi:hypothetical protein